MTSNSEPAHARTPSVVRFSEAASRGPPKILQGKGPRGTVQGGPRGTVSRNSRGGRPDHANPANRPSQYHVYHEKQNIDYYPNKRGILKCQAWKLQHASIKPKMPEIFTKMGQVQPKKHKIQYPYCSGESELYCPRCDMFFDNLDEYQDHLLIKAMKAPHVTKVKELKAQAEMQHMVAKQQVSQLLMRKTIHRNAQQYDEDFEFQDKRDKRIMHWKHNKRHYRADELLEEVRDARDQARAIRARRVGQRRKTQYTGLGPIAEVLMRIRTTRSIASHKPKNPSILQFQNTVNKITNRNRAIFV